MLELRYKEVAEAFTYDRETGVLYWRKRTRGTIRHKYVAGSSKGAKGNSGYSHVRFMGKTYKVHRIIMMLCFGHIPENAEIDHVNHIRDDNRLVNLRFVTRGDNLKNKSIGSDNTTGITGVCFDKSQNKFMAHIRVNHQAHFLGRYDTLEEAAAAREEANLKFKFHANHGK